MTFHARWMKHAALSALSALVTLTGCDRAEPETYLIPEGYVGPVYTVQGRPDGEPEQYEEGRRLYNVPADGVLLTQFGENTGEIDEQFFYVGPGGKRREITGRSYTTIPDTPASRADTAVLVHGASAGSLGANRPYREHHIGTKADILDWGARGTGSVTEALARRGVTTE